MRALVSMGGVVIPERLIAEICPHGSGSRVFVAGTVGATGNSIVDIGGHYEDVSGAPIQLAELLGWEIVNKSANGT